MPEPFRWAGGFPTSPPNPFPLILGQIFVWRGSFFAETSLNPGRPPSRAFVRLFFSGDKPGGGVLALPPQPFSCFRPVSFDLSFQIWCIMLQLGVCRLLFEASLPILPTFVFCTMWSWKLPTAQDCCWGCDELFLMLQVEVFSGF